METLTIIEVCVDCIESLKNALNGGADRIELCSALSEGGLTPSFGLLQLAKRLTRIPIFVMIRPRCGNFVYSPDEIEIMKEDINNLKPLADGFVFGGLTIENQVDIRVCNELASHCDGRPITFHRAIDEVFDPVAAIEDVCNISGVCRVLTSGGKATALEGANVIHEMVLKADHRIQIMAGSGVSSSNVVDILFGTGVHEVHGSLRDIALQTNVTSMEEVQKVKQLLLQKSY